MASANAVSIVRELGIRESGQPRSLAFLGPEDHARAAAPFDNSCDSRHIHAGSHNGKAKCAGGSCRTVVPRKNARDVSSAWKNSISCAYFVPFCAHAKMEHFR